MDAEQVRNGSNNLTGVEDGKARQDKAKGSFTEVEGAVDGEIVADDVDVVARDQRRVELVIQGRATVASGKWLMV